MKHLLILFLIFLSASVVAQKTDNYNMVKGTKTAVTLGDTSSAQTALASGAYPVAVYDAFGKYIGKVYSAGDLVNLWNSVQNNRLSGVLDSMRTSSGTDSFRIVFSSNKQRVGANKVLLPSAVTSATLYAWYDVTDRSKIHLTTDTPTTKVDTVYDKSGNNRNLTQTTANLRPTYYLSDTYGGNHLPYISMNNHVLQNLSMSFAMPFTVYSVMRVKNPATNPTGYPYTSVFQFESHFYNGVQTAINSSTVNNAPTPTLVLVTNASPQTNSAGSFRPNKWVAGTFNFSTTNSYLRYNNENYYMSGPGGLSSFTPDRFVMNSADVDFSEIIVINGQLSAAEDAGIRQYLAQKYHLSPSEVFVFFGDSITAGQNSTTVITDAFASIIANDAGGIPINNGTAFTTIDSFNVLYPGVPGSNLKDKITSLTTANYDPDHTTVIMNYGSNDFSWALSNPTEWQARYKNFINRLISNGFHPDRIIVGGPPYQLARSHTPGADDATLEKYIGQMCQEIGIKFFPSVTYMYNNGGEIFITHPDSIHLTNAGHQQFAKGLESVMSGVKTATFNPAYINNADVDMTTQPLLYDSMYMIFNRKTQKFNPAKNAALNNNYKFGQIDLSLSDLGILLNTNVLDSVTSSGHNYYTNTNTGAGFEGYALMDKILPAGADGYVQIYRPMVQNNQYYSSIWFTPQYGNLHMYDYMANSPANVIIGAYNNNSTTVLALDKTWEISSGGSGQSFVIPNNYYVRIRRTSGKFYLDQSSDAVTWTPIYNYVYQSNDAMYIGINVDKTYNSSHIYFPKCAGCAPAPLGYPATSPISESSTIYTPTTGQTISVNQNETAVINPAGNLAALTVNLPPFPADKGVVKLLFTKNVTALTTQTIDGSTITNGPTTAVLGSSAALVYNKSANKWFAGSNSPTLDAVTTAGNTTTNKAAFGSATHNGIATVEGTSTTTSQIGAFYNASNYTTIYTASNGSATISATGNYIQLGPQIGVGHILGLIYGAAPSTGTLGTNVTSATIPGTNTDLDFKITIVTSGAVSGTWCKIALNGTPAYGAAPSVVFSPGNSTTATNCTAVWANPTSATNIDFGGSISGAGTYVFYFHTMQ